MGLSLSKPVPRQSLFALLISALLASTCFANPQLLPQSGPWTSGDYTHVLFAVRNGQITLPRRDNPKTAAFFAKLIDRNNIDQLMASSLASAKKRLQILIILSTTGELRGSYRYSVSLGDDVQGELVEIQAFRLYLTGRLALLDAEDGETACPTSYKCDNAVLTTLSGTLDSLADGRVFTSEQRITLAQAFGDQYATIRTKLTEAEHLEITTRLAAIVADESEAEVKGILAAALQSAKSGN